MGQTMILAFTFSICVCEFIKSTLTDTHTHTLLLSSLEEQAGNKNLVVAQILFWDQIFNFVHTFLIERSMFIDDMQYNMNDTHSQEKNEYVVVDRILLEDMCFFGQMKVSFLKVLRMRRREILESHSATKANLLE